VRCCGARDAMWGRLDFQLVRGHPIADGQTETVTPLVVGQKRECGCVINHQRRAACSPHETVWLGYLGWIFMSLGALTPFRTPLCELRAGDLVGSASAPCAVRD
jgi:hypothetical protein